jgi:hypothetical protein
VAAGADVVYPLADRFYGERAGRLRDPFGPAMDAQPAHRAPVARRDRASSGRPLRGQLSTPPSAASRDEHDWWGIAAAWAGSGALRPLRGRTERKPPPTSRATRHAARSLPPLPGRRSQSRSSRTVVHRRAMGDSSQAAGSIHAGWMRVARLARASRSRCSAISRMRRPRSSPAQRAASRRRWTIVESARKHLATRRSGSEGSSGVSSSR